MKTGTKPLNSFTIELKELMELLEDNLWTEQIHLSLLSMGVVKGYD
jgi:hypothetical protein